jgi:predicted nucleotidyltransferase
MQLPSPARTHLSAHPHPLLFVTVSGAHLYGFESPDSDWDLRGCHIASAAAVLSLDPPGETHEVMDKVSTPEVDLVTHDARKFFLMMLKNNGYVLEQIFSPLVAYAAPEFEELKSIASQCICRHHRHHFFHFGLDQWKLIGGSGAPTVKGLLYTYRPLLAGIHLTRTGKVESNLRTLNSEARIPEIDDLIARKLAGAEKMILGPNELEHHRPLFERLCRELDDARERSSLPDEPKGREALNDLLLRLRLAR